MGKQYADLEKSVLAILSNGGDPANSQDEAVANYWKWKINPASSKHNFKDPSSARKTKRKLKTIGLVPFATLPVTGVMAKETISTRAYEAAVAKTLTGFGIEDLTGTSNALFLGRFKPAKVYWRTGASTTPSERESRITGRKYKSVYAPGDEGYSVPIGKGSGGTNLLARQAAVKGILTPSTGIVPSISFSPEVFTG